MTEEYVQALEKSRQESKRHRGVTEKYRAREIGDDEFIASRQRLERADAEFDKAYEREQYTD